jgi:hypothetical protein
MDPTPLVKLLVLCLLLLSCGVFSYAFGFQTGATTVEARVEEVMDARTRAAFQELMRHKSDDLSTETVVAAK